LADCEELEKVSDSSPAFLAVLSHHSHILPKIPPKMAPQNGTNGDLSTDVTYEDLIALEYSFDDAELEVLRTQTKAFAPLYAKREALVERIPNFWALVVEQAPPDLDQYIQPSDSEVFAECLKEIKIERFDDATESPRSFKLVMRFDKERNKWFEDETLEKPFYFRRARDSWTGLVSEPVKVNWKKGKDLTNGLTDAAVALWKARQAVNADSTSPQAQAKLSEHKAVAKKLEINDPSVSSFFSVFGYVSERRYVSVSENAEASKKLKARRDAKAKDLIDDDEAAEQAELERAEVEQEVEVCPHGSDIANFIAEDLYPDAIKYFSTYLPGIGSAIAYVRDNVERLQLTAE
jgi:Nucleosome assembly protein (NAP)